MNKSGLAAIAGALLITSFVAHGLQRTGGEDAYYIDVREGVTNDVVVDWKTPKGGDGYTGPDYWGDVNVYYEQPEYIQGGNDQFYN